MKNKPMLYVAVFTLSTIILGILFRSRIFLVGSIASLSTYVVATRSFPPEDFDLDVYRESEEREVYVGDEIELTINIENMGDELHFVEIHDVLPSVVEVVEGSNHQILEIGEDEKKQIKYKISCPVTGKIKPGPIKIRYRDPLNFFSKNISSEKEMTLRVLPKIEEMDSVDVFPSHTKHWLGNIKSNSIGMGSEFFSLREYHPGDQFKDINWKATARNMSPITNEYEGEKSGDVILVVDGYEESVVGNVEHNTLRASIRATASLASNILSDRNRVGLIVMGDYLNWVYPSTGKMHFYRIMENLIKLEKGGMWELRDVKWLLKEFFPRKSLIIFISPLTVPEFSETIIDLGLKEYDVMVISPDPLKIEKEVVAEYEAVAERLCQTDRQSTIDKLWKYGMVVDWDPTDPLEPALEEVLKYKKKSRKR